MATRRTNPPQPQPANLNVDQMRLGVTRLQRRIADLEAFDSQSVQQRWGPEAKALQTSIEETLAAVFGHNTVEYRRYRDAARLDQGPMAVTPDYITVRSGGLAGGYNDLNAGRQYLAEGKQRSILLLKQAVRGLEEEIGDRAALLAPAPAGEAAPADKPIPPTALIEIRETLENIKTQLPAITASNAIKAEIHADISQVEVETERPAPRRRFMVMYLESLRDNLAKAAGAGTAAALVAAVGGILAKYFGVF